jgi:hypothetical protein
MYIAHGGNPLSGGEKIPDQLVRFNLSLVDNRHRIEPDLEEEELAAIGYVTAQWAHLEHGILASTLVLSYENEAAPPKETTSLTFEKRLGAFRVTIERFVTDKKEKARLLKLVSKAANLSASRHKLAHGLWTWDYTDPKTLRASSFRPNVQFEVDFNAEGIRRLGERIGELNFELSCPGGKEDAWKSMAELASEGRGASRSALLQLSGDKVGAGRRPLQGRSPKRKRPGLQSSGD